MTTSEVEEPCCTVPPLKDGHDKGENGRQPEVLENCHHEGKESPAHDVEEGRPSPLGTVQPPPDTESPHAHGAMSTTTSPREEPFSFQVDMTLANGGGRKKVETPEGPRKSIVDSQEQPPPPPPPPTCRPHRSSAVSSDTFQSTIMLGAISEGSTDRQGSSLELRRMPVNVLLKPCVPESTSDVSECDKMDQDYDEDNDERRSETTKGGRRRKRRDVDRDYDVLRKFCLRPGFTLRTQMMLSFGSICIITITVVVSICIALTVLAGNNVRKESTVTVERLAYKYRSTRARYLAEALDQRLLLFDTVKLIDEVTMDRFDGYPDASDDGVPFNDIDTGKNIYPIKARPVPLEWNVTPNVDRDNYEEFLQSRWPFYESRPVDASNAGFSIQGLCDPDEIDPMGDLFWPNCTEANNNITTGGAIAPSPLAEVLHRKGSDLVPVFRALFESRQEIRDLGLYFLNNGAGASIYYPHYATNTQNTYTSIGCDWLLSPHPYNVSRTIGTKEMIQNCHSEGEVVSSRAYNPMERGWCRDQALNPNQIIANAWEDAWSPGEFILIMGKSVYDRSTREFLACIFLGISLSQVDEVLLESSRVIRNSEASLVQFNEFGHVVSSSRNFTRVSNGTSIPIYDKELGLTKESFTLLYTLVNYEERWDPETVREAYEWFVQSDGKYNVAAYPVPPVPVEYDPSYRPIFLVIASTSVDTLKAAVEDVNDNIDQRVRNIITFAITVWAIGVIVATVVICIMARVLTSPLTQMNRVANEIVNNFGETKKESEILNPDSAVTVKRQCTPKTELSEVVAEFNVMVASFSGASQAKSQKFKDDEVKNRFPERKALMELYSQRNHSSFKYNPTCQKDIKIFFGVNGRTFDQNGSDGSSIEFLHFGTNVATASIENLREDGKGGGCSSVAGAQKRWSPLFWWIVVLIVTPLFFITILVATGVVTTINSEFDKSTIDTETELVDLYQRALVVYARLRSDYVSSLTERSTNDLHLLTRYTSWLLFEALRRSNSFTKSTTGIEECKSHVPDFSQCEYYEKEFVCDCANKERGYEELCTNYSTSVRHVEKNYWTAQTSTDPDGSRFSTDYPEMDFSPKTTEWWDEATSLPGWQRGAFAEGHETTYDRLRAISAVPLFQPLYRYGLGEGKESTLGVNVAFEGDGMFFGFGGCFSSRHVELVQWKSTEDNDAANLRPELCPIGKYGYDPRCRGWYDKGRRMSLAKESLLHVTAPYRFASASSYQYAQSATIAIMDPFTGKHVGQSLLDFLAQPIYHTLENDTHFYDGGFPILIAVEDDALNTIIGPGVSQAQASVPISQGVLPTDFRCKSHNDECLERYNTFEMIAEDMRKGKVGVKSFYRSMENGSIETMHMAYAPVSVTSLQPVNSSDFSCGVKRTRHLIYSLAHVEIEEGVLMPFQSIRDTTRRQSNICIGVLSVVIFLAITIIIYISHVLASSFTEPMLYLLGLIRYINKHGVDKDPPPVRRVRASYEIVAFSRTLEALYRIVRSANIAFFAGELEAAYRVLVDALRLFRRLGNNKAVGIACNNIGNTLLAIYREMWALNENDLYGLTRKEVVSQGIAHFHDAIQLGEKAYDEFYELQGWSPSCLDFMQHLSNRYFNRGLFLLHVKNDHEEPQKIEALGMRDLQISGDMDQEVVSYSEEIGWGSADKAEKRFNVNLIRLRGYNTLLSLGYTNDWGVEDLIEDTMGILKTESQNAETSELFANVSLAGRLQEIEVQLIRRKVLQGDLETAARVAVRMIVEDERVFGEAMLKALEVLISYAESDVVDDDFKRQATPALKSYHRVILDVLGEKMQNAKDKLVDSTFSSFGKSTSGSIIRCSSTTRHSTHCQEESSRFVTMEDF